MTIILYYMPHSPSCRSVMMLSKRLGINLDLKFISVPEEEQLEPYFTEINPQHTVPTIDDDGFILWESRAILSYLVSKYAKNDSLYPEDLRKRAIVDQRLYYDIDTLYKSIITYYSPVIIGKVDQPPAEHLPALQKSFEILNTFLEDTMYVAGDNLTIADYTIVVNVCTTMVRVQLFRAWQSGDYTILKVSQKWHGTFELLQAERNLSSFSTKAFNFDIKNYENVAAWYERCKKVMKKDGFQEINENQAKFLGQLYLKNLKQYIE